MCRPCARSYSTPPRRQYKSLINLIILNQKLSCKVKKPLAYPSTGAGCFRAPVSRATHVSLNMSRAALGSLTHCARVQRIPYTISKAASDDDNDQMYIKVKH
ncbi:hypothetical protein O3G_MSEX011459 [Manduca sexta]|uniref:Uncharacterized protein n=1 Tax=Manduca sexta TaxID=7130 RepID=A0A921ZL57_MANSE|nr:hypothetical protein O3G_MSEX011459 [Manduca sexta]